MTVSEWKRIPFWVAIAVENEWLDWSDVRQLHAQYPHLFAGDPPVSSFWRTVAVALVLAVLVVLSAWSR